MTPCASALRLLGQGFPAEAMALLAEHPGDFDAQTALRLWQAGFTERVEDALKVGVGRVAA